MRLACSTTIGHRAPLEEALERIRQLGLGGYQDYLSYLERRPDEAGQLPNLLRVTLSRFFRERACWEELVGKALPELLARKADSVLRVLNTPGLFMIGRKEALYLDNFFGFEQLSATGCQGSLFHSCSMVMGLTCCR